VTKEQTYLFTGSENHFSIDGWSWLLEGYVAACSTDLTLYIFILLVWSQNWLLDWSCVHQGSPITCR